MLSKNDFIKILIKYDLSQEEIYNALALFDDFTRHNVAITEDGEVFLYHATSKSNARAILENQCMFGKEDSIFFSTKYNGQIQGYGEAIIKVLIPLYKLLLDDEFKDELHVKLECKPYTSIQIKVLEIVK